MAPTGMKEKPTFDLRRDAAARGVLLVAHRGVWGGNIPPNTIIYDYKVQLVAGRSDDMATAGGDPEHSWGWLADLGYDLVQTDWLLACSLFLERTGRRTS